MDKIKPCCLFAEIQRKGLDVIKKYKCTEHFRWSELLHNQTDKPDFDVLMNIEMVANLLEIYREKLFNERPVIITSGWRSEDYNKKIGGAKKSFHLSGLAVDFVVQGYEPYYVYTLLDNVHKGGLEKARTWTHLDLGNNRRFDEASRIIFSNFNPEMHNKIVGGLTYEF